MWKIHKSMMGKRLKELGIHTNNLRRWPLHRPKHPKRPSSWEGHRQLNIQGLQCYRYSWNGLCQTAIKCNKREVLYYFGKPPLWPSQLPEREMRNNTQIALCLLVKLTIASAPNAFSAVYMNCNWPNADL